MSESQRRLPLVFFAGDSTADPELLGTMLGARLSGIREAKKILHIIKEGHERKARINVQTSSKVGFSSVKT